MDAHTLSSEVAAATLSPTATHAGTRTLSTRPKRMAVIEAWDSMVRGAAEENGLPELAGPIFTTHYPAGPIGQGARREGFLINRENVI